CLNLCPPPPEPFGGGNDLCLIFLTSLYFSSRVWHAGHSGFPASFRHTWLSQERAAADGLEEQDALIQGKTQALRELYAKVNCNNQMLQSYANYMSSANATSTLRELYRLVDTHNHMLQSYANYVSNATATPAAQPLPGPIPPPRSQAVTSSEFRPNLPERFSGNMKDYKGFLFHCRLLFQNSPNSFSTDYKRITFILSQLTGRALEWAQARFSSDVSLNCSYSDFISEFSQVFNQETDQTIDSHALFSIKQGNSSVADFSINFRVKAAASGWNQSALKGAYFMALNENIKDQLATLDEPATLEELIRLTIRLDNRIRATNSSKPRNLGSLSASLPLPVQASHSGEMEVEPMQVGHTRLTPEERQRRFLSKLCIYCGEGGHFIASCPAKSKAWARQRI
uniref:CCHC-type domain-containing protein n=1 Tax=Cyprinodon variegatus TaxID=28743 RepID=A0A3Q2DAW1_CYPVA